MAMSSTSEMVDKREMPIIGRQLKETIWMQRIEEEEEMKQCGLYEDAIIKLIIETRIQFESIIDNDPTNMEHLNDYIKSEKQFYSRIAKKGNKTPAHQNIETKFLKRIKLLFQYGIEEFCAEASFLMAYFRFCERINCEFNVKETTDNILQKLSGKPEVWLNVGRFYAYGINEYADAVITYVTGVREHPTYEELYVDLIKFDVLQLLNFKSTKTELTKRARVIDRIHNTVAKSCNNITNPDFFILILKILEKHNSTMMIQCNIVDYLRNESRHSAKVWHVLAQRQKNDVYAMYDSMQLNDRIDYHDKGGTALGLHKRTRRVSLESCFATYREGLSILPVEERSNLWRIYLDFLFELYMETTGACTVLKLETLQAALDEAFKEKCLQETHYIQWAKLPDIDNEKLIRILEEATELFPHSVELWTTRLHLYIVYRETTDVNHIFKIANGLLGDDALPLWELMVNYYTTDSEEKIVALYEDGINQGEVISNFIKAKYLETVLATKGTAEGRILYTRLTLLVPHCKELHKIMLKHESSLNNNNTFLQKVYELYCEQFGKEDIKPWTSYIQYYIKNMEDIVNFQEQVTGIYQKAKVSLGPPLDEQFEERYNTIVRNIIF